MSKERNVQSKFILPSEKPIYSGRLQDYAVGTSVKIDGKWYVVVEVGGSKEVFLMDDNFFAFNLPGNTPVEQSGYTTVNVTPY